MSNYQYTIILHPDPDEGGYTVTVPALPGCVTQGETLEEAIAMPKDAIRLHVDALMSEGEPVPEEHEHPQAIIINVTACVRKSYLLLTERNIGLGLSTAPLP